jgi:hypothetical protein
MNDIEISSKITGYLDSGVAAIKAGTAYKLQVAREQALARLAEPEHASQLAMTGAGGGTFGGRRPVRMLSDVRVWVGILLIVGCTLYYQYWTTAQRTRELIETDAAILTSDLPIEAYVDRGFQNWLTHSEP